MAVVLSSGIRVCWRVGVVKEESVILGVGVGGGEDRGLVVG